MKGNRDVEIERARMRTYEREREGARFDEGKKYDGNYDDRVK